MNTNKNWEGFTDISHPNWTGKTPRRHKFDGIGAWAKDSDTPPCGWIAAIIYGVVVCVTLLLAASYAAAVIGSTT